VELRGDGIKDHRIESRKTVNILPGPAQYIMGEKQSTLNGNRPISRYQFRKQLTQGKMHGGRDNSVSVNGGGGGGKN